MRWILALAIAVSTQLRAAGVAETATPDVRRHAAGAKVTLVNVWATWCVPCVAEMDDLVRLDAAFSDKHVLLIGISMDDAVPGDRESSKARVDSFLRKKGVTFRNFYYTGPIPKLQEHFEFEGEIPLTVLYDRQGNERRRYQGAIQPEVVKRDIQKLLSER
jgi:thiol-disulfide isomerase/thioredoxin